MRVIFVTALTLALSAGAAAAQQTPPVASHPGSTQSYGYREQAVVRQPIGTRANYEAFLDEAEGNNVRASLERIDRANRISGLIEYGRCEEARELARQEGDRQMALRARQLCRARS